MREILKVLLSLSLSGSLVILVLLACRVLLRKRVRRRWQYYAWLVAVFRLLLPLSPEGSPLDTLFQAPPFQAVAFDAAAFGEGLAPARPEVSGGTGFDAAPGPDSEDPPAFDAQTPPVFDSEGSAGSNLESPADSGGLALPAPAAILVLLWLSGALVLLIWNITSYLHFLRYLRAGCREAEDPALLDLLAETGERLGVRRPVELYENPLVASPLLLGLVRPRILFPSLAVPEADFRHTVLHELTHYRRRDLLYKWLVRLTVCLHWFNPLVWVMAREIDRDCELACDEAALRTLAPEERRAYGDTLLRALEAGGGYHAVPGSAGLGENAELLKERLTAIMRFKTPSRGTALLSLLLTAALVTGAAAAGTYTGPGKRASSPGAKAPSAPQEDVTPAVSNESLRSRSQVLAELYYEDGDIAGFSFAIPFLSREEQEAWLERCYEDENAAFFSVLVNYPDWDEAFLKDWLLRTQRENVTFLSILLKAMDRDEEVNALEEELAARQMEEYKAAGIAREGTVYYYQGHMVRIFLDPRPDGSCITLDMNPLGVLDIEVERDGEGRIQSVRELSAAEVTELFGDWDGPEDGSEALNITIPINREALEGNTYWLLGEYALSAGDRIHYDVSAETGERMAIGFRDPEHRPEEVSYFRVSSRREQGALRCTADFTLDGETVKPGIYRLYLQAPEGDLGNLRGSVTLSRSGDGSPDAAGPQVMTREELPAAARETLSACAAGTWYIFRSQGRQYLYCAGFPWRYAWQPTWEDGVWQVRIRKLKLQNTGYLLLSFPDNAPLRVTLDGAPVLPERVPSA